MTDILVTSPFRPFTLPTQFKAVFNGYIYCGTVDAVDPSVSQVQVYLVNEAGDKVPVAQPLRTNAGGYLVYNGQPAKFVTNSNHSLLVQDSFHVQTWYVPDMAVFDPQAFIEDISGSGGASLIGTSSGKTVEDELFKSGLVRGNDLVKYAVSGCAVRRDTTKSPDWGPVSDSAHIPINVTSIVGGVDVRVNYIGQKIGTFVAGPDESFARDGALVGGSVAANFANVSIGAPCSFSVDLSTGAFEFDTHYFDQIRFALSIGGTGNITLTHPGIRTMLHPIIRYVAPNSSSKHLDVFYQTKTAAGITSCFLVGDVEGTISYNGTDWVLGSCDQWVTSDLSFAWNASRGELTVTHPVLNGSPELNLTQLYLGTPLHVSGGANAGNGFKIYFHNTDGTPAALGTGLGTYFSRGRNGIRKAPAGKLLVHLGHVQVNCDHVDYPGGNFWFNAVMQN